jgi:hypothetical protein
MSQPQSSIIKSTRMTIKVHRRVVATAWPASNYATKDLHREISTKRAKEWWKQEEEEAGPLIGTSFCLSLHLALLEIKEEKCN